MGFNSGFKGFPEISGLCTRDRASSVMKNIDFFLSTTTMNLRIRVANGCKIGRHV